VRKGYSLADLLKDPQHIGQRSRTGGGLIESRALHELHRVKDATVIKRADIVYRDDTRVFEQRDYTSLAHHPGRKRASRVRVIHHFHGDLSSEVHILSKINGAHPA
jgi:hypothetical protein